MATIPLRKDYCDETVQQRITTFLTSRKFPSFSGLGISVCNGAVTVSGVVDSFYEKQVALNTCQRVAGVIELIDEIRVRKAKPIAPR